jgi:hypothetical protein
MQMNTPARWITFVGCCAVTLAVQAAQTPAATAETELWKNANIPIGVTHLKVTAPTADSEDINAARFITDARQQLSSTCRTGFKVLTASCELTPQSSLRDEEGRSDFAFAMGPSLRTNHLNSTQTEIVVAADGIVNCRAKVLSPEAVGRLNLHLNCSSTSAARDKPLDSRKSE